MAPLNIYSRHVTALDQQFHFEDKESSSVKSIEQDFDDEALEHVITIEYRVKVSEEPDPQLSRNTAKEVCEPMRRSWMHGVTACGRWWKSTQTSTSTCDFGIWFNFELLVP